MESVGTHVRRWSRPAIAGGIMGSLFLAAAVAAPSMGFVPNVGFTSPHGTTLSIEELASGTTCDTYAASATCTAVNDYSTKPIARGQSGSIALTFKNTGDVRAGQLLLSLGDLVHVAPWPAPTSAELSPMHLSFFRSIDNRSTTVYSGPMDEFPHSLTLGGLDVNQSVKFSFIVSNPLTSHSDAPRVSQSMQWQFVQ